MNFEIFFGKRTKERSDCPDGWSVKFKDLTKANGSKGFVGIVNTSWWGDKKVKLLPYESLSWQEKRRYPDLKAQYYKSVLEE